MRKQRRFSIENLEERTNPAAFNIGQGTDVFRFNVAGYSLRQDNASFSTSSSAFGFQEANMTHPTAADTAGGGTVQSTLNDAFDGALSWGLTDGAGGSTPTTYVDSDGIVDITPAPTGPGNSTTTTGTLLTGDPET